MKSSIEVLVFAGAMLFGVSMINWFMCFSPSFIVRNEMEIVIEDDDNN